MADLRKFLYPSSVCVIGASRNPRKLGARLLSSIRFRGFAGNIYPVTRNADELDGLTAYGSVAELPETPDIAFVIVPGPSVLDALKDCHAKGIKNASVISSGFAEAGGVYVQAQADFVAFANETGMNISGPNSEGFYNARANLAATFSPTVLHRPEDDQPLIRNLGIIAQSGGLAFALFSHAMRRRLGVNYVISSGNEAVLSGTDFIDFMVEDPVTDIVLVFAEALSDPQKFAATAARAQEAGKPLLIAKVGETDAGRRAAKFHTASETGLPGVFDEIADAHGVIRVSDIDGYSDVAAAFTGYAEPRGKRIGIVTASGGTGVWLTDKLTRAGLSVPELSKDLQDIISPMLPHFGSARNPVDVTAQAARTGEMFKAIEYLDKSGEVDAIIACPPLSSDTFLSEAKEELERARHETGLPVYFFSYAQPNEQCMKFMGELGLYCFTTLDGIVRAIEARVAYGTT